MNSNVGPIQWNLDSKHQVKGFKKSVNEIQK